MRYPITFSFALAGLVLVSAASLARADVSNGNFLNGSNSPGSFETLNTNSTVLTGWAISGSVDWIGTYWAAPLATGSAGGGAVDLDGSAAAGTISQAVTTVAGQAYDLSFYLSGNPDGPPPIKNLQVGLSGATPGSATYTASQTAGLVDNSTTFNANAWTLYTLPFTAGSGVSTTISFQSLDTGLEANGNISYGPVVAGVSLTTATTDTAMPEPGLYAALAIGMVGLGLFARRRAIS